MECQHDKKPFKWVGSGVKDRFLPIGRMTVWETVKEMNCDSRRVGYNNSALCSIIVVSQMRVGAMASAERTDRMGYSADAALIVDQWSVTDGIDRFPQDLSQMRKMAERCYNSYGIVVL